MAQTVIDWMFSATGVANQNGSHAAVVQGAAAVAGSGATLPGSRPTSVVQGAAAVAGPGATLLGARPTALRFGPGISCRARLSPGEVSATRFAIRISFRATATVTTRGNLVESSSLPFALYAEPGTAADRFNVAALVANGASGWSGTNTSNRMALLLNQWYVASLVFDLDTVALLIDNTVIAVMAWSQGALQAPSGDLIQVGSWLDGVRWPFTGEIAGVQVWHDIPADLEAKLDAERGTAEWHLTRKENDVRGTLNLGPKTGDFFYHSATASYQQPYTQATISYCDSHGTAFVIYGAILAKWRSDETLRTNLGALASDEINGQRAGTRKNMFEKGCIYWSPASGAVPVLGQLYLDYENLGEGAHAIGSPIADVEAINGGKVQRFQNGKMFLRNGASNAFEAHGAILAKFETTGGPGKWGFPTSHESDVLRGTTVIGKKSEFTGCTIYWSPATPASLIHGAIRDRYVGTPSLPGEGGPLGDLGFPISDESDIPGAAGSRYNTFQNGSILWFQGPMYVCRPFTVYLGNLNTKEEDRDIGDLDGQNDLYCWVSLYVNGNRVLERRYPEKVAGKDTSFPSANVMNLNINVPYTLTPNSPGLTARVEVNIWEDDLIKDAPLGTMTRDLNMANAWGLRDNTNGLFRASNFDWVNHMDWAVKPVVTPSTPFDFWGVENRGTPTLDYAEYALAFKDVDPHFEVDMGIIDDAIKALYYQAVVKGIASGGNCFGMCLEAIYAWKERSRLGRPLARFTNWADVENDFNPKHAYQAGADVVWWFLGQFLSGNTHDPKSVFQDTSDAFARGENPMLCIAQNYDFTGAPHCILPIAWDRNSTPWRIEVFDPNFMNQRRFVTVDPATNTFRYDGSSDGTRIYTGDAWSGGRMHYIPWTTVNHVQFTPGADALLLLVSGVVLIFGDSTEVSALTDEKGNRVDGASAKNRDQLKGKLLRVPGLSGNDPVRGSFYVGKQARNATVFNPSTMSQAATLAKPGAGTLSGPALMSLMRKNGIAALKPAQPTDLDTIRAALVGKTAGKLDAYLKRGLFGVQVQSNVTQGERFNLGFERMSGRDNEITLQSDRTRAFGVTLVNKLGGGRDFLRINLAGLPGEANKQARLNIQPGVGVIDLMASGAAANVQVTMEGKVGGKDVKSSFNTRVQGGQRLVLPDLGDPAVLKVGSIDTLLGTGRNFQIIKRQ